MSTEEPTDLMEIRSKHRGGLTVTNPNHLSVSIKEFNDSLYFNLSVDIAKWLSSLMGEEISPDLCTSLANGIVLCRLLDEFIPGGKLTKYNKNADTIPAFAYDNIHIFSEKCKELGIRDNYVLNPSHFEKKQIKEIVNCILLLAFLGKEKKMESCLPALEESQYRDVLPTKSAFVEGALNDEVVDSTSDSSSSTSDSSDNDEKKENVKEVDDNQMWVSIGIVLATVIMSFFN